MTMAAGLWGRMRGARRLEASRRSESGARGGGRTPLGMRQHCELSRAWVSYFLTVGESPPLSRRKQGDKPHVLGAGQYHRSAAGPPRSPDEAPPCPRPRALFLTSAPRACPSRFTRPFCQTCCTRAYPGVGLLALVARARSVSPRAHRDELRCHVFRAPCSRAFPARVQSRHERTGVGRADTRSARHGPGSLARSLSAIPRPHALTPVSSSPFLALLGRRPHPRPFRHLSSRTAPPKRPKSTHPAPSCGNNVAPGLRRSLARSPLGAVAARIGATRPNPGRTLTPGPRS